MTTRHILRALTWLLAGGVGALHAGTLSFPDEGAGFATLQDALDAAQDGDVVEIASGEYRGNFTIDDRLGVTVRGLGEVVLDARPGGATGSGPALVATNCPGLRLEELTFRNAGGVDAAGAGLRVNGSSQAVLKRLEVSGCETYGILVQQSDELLVEDCTLRGNTGGLHIEGNLAELRHVTVENDGQQGVVVFGDDATLEQCRVAVIRGGGGVNISGARPTVLKCSINSVLDAGTNGLTTSGGSPDIRNNRVTSCDTGIFVVYGGGGVVKGNDVLRCSSSGLRLGGVSHTLTIAKNSVRQCGGPGIWVDGDGQLLVDNVVEECDGDGFLVQSASCVLRKNRAVGNTHDGIDVDESATSTSLEGNIVKRNGGEGIENSGTDTRLSDNRAKKNRIDFAADGTSIDEGGNDFVVAGAPSPEID